MKKILLSASVAACLVSVSARAQEGCGTGRYNTEVFTDYTLTSDIVYGANGAADLLLDFYEPTGDSIAERPLIVLAHGGSFLGGSKTDDPAVTESCIRFAKMGYVAASINYTLGFDQFPPQAASASRTVYRAARQMKTAVRFFRKDAATTNTYRINTDVIFIGGNSAGAITALHAAYLDQYSELPAGIDTSALGQGEINGFQFGNAGYSAEINGVINMAGAIADTVWMDNNHEIPLVSAHGDADATVPFGFATIGLGPLPILPVYGSGEIDVYTTNNGMNADLLVFPGDDHCPWNSNATKMTQMINHNRDFLYNIVCVLAGVEENENAIISVFPNPTSDVINIRVPAQNENMQYAIIDFTGKTVMAGNSQAQNELISLDVKHLAAGLYTVQVRTGKQVKTAKIIIR